MYGYIVHYVFIRVNSRFRIRGVIMKKQENPIGYRPSKDVRGFIDEYCPEDGGLSRSQFIEIAMRFLMMRPKAEIDQIILGVMTGRWDQESFEVEKKTQGAAHKKAAG